MARAHVAGSMLLLFASLLVVVVGHAQVAQAPAVPPGLYEVRLDVVEAGPRCGDRAQVGDVANGLWAIDTTAGGRSFAIRWIGHPPRFFGGTSAPAVVAGPAIQVTWNPGGSDQDVGLLGVGADGVVTGQVRTVRAGCTTVMNVSAHRLR